MNITMTPTLSSRSSTSSSPSRVTDLPDNLAQAVQTQLDLISSFQLWLDKQTPSRGCDTSTWRKVTSKLASQGDGYKNRIADLQSNYHEPHQNEDSAIPDHAWKLQVHQKKDSDELVLVVEVGGDDDPIEVIFESQAKLNSAVEVCYVMSWFLNG